MKKYFIRKLFSSKIVSLIMLVQFALALILLNHSMSVNANYTVSVAQVANIYGDTSIWRLRDKTDETTLMNDTAAQSDVRERQAELYQWLKSSDDFSFLSFQEYSIRFSERLPGGDAFISSYLAGILSMKAFRADEDFLARYPVSVAEGRTFAHEDFVEQDTLPVILGSHYGRYYAVGDSIDVPSTPFQRASKLTVVGIAQPNTYVACPTRPEGAILLDAYILYPYLLPNENTTFGEFDMLIFQSIVIPADFDAASSSIAEKARQLGLYEIELTSPTRKSESYASRVSSNSGFVWVTTAAVVGFALITIVSALMYRFSLHRKDFAEFMLCGATRGMLAFEFTMEAAVVLLIGNAAAFVVCHRAGTLHRDLMMAYNAGILLAVYALTWLALRKNDIAKQMQEGNV